MEQRSLGSSHFAVGFGLWCKKGNRSRTNMAVTMADAVQVAVGLRNSNHRCL